MMTSAPVRLRLTVMAVGMMVSLAGNLRAEPADGETLLVRLVHPERQAAEVLRLFEGSRAADPAAALAAWKRATGDPGQLGKPLEAVIALFNPEMAREWGVLHEAELRLEFGGGGQPRWHAVIPRDDGTVAAAVTAQRLSGGGPEPPLGDQAVRVSVERLGPSGAILAAVVGDAVILGSSREELKSALGRLAARAGMSPAAGPGKAENAGITPALERIDSGLAFVLDPARLAQSGNGGELAWRRAACLLHGLQCRRLQGTLALKGDRLGLEVTTQLDQDARARMQAGRGATVEPEWLERVPSAGAMAVASIAFEPGAEFWTWMFGVADRVDRADPARAELAPLRGRINLLAAAAGVSLEADLWPHLRGFTAAIMGAEQRPGVPNGALLVLHSDSQAAAARLATEVVPRLSTLLTGRKGIEQRPGAASSAGAVQRLGNVGGRELTIWMHGRDVFVAWGDETGAASRNVGGKAKSSVGPLCGDWARVGKRAPQRVAAVWPARCWAPAGRVAFASPAWRTLEEDPPVVWWGWNEGTIALDSIQCSGLRQRIHRFLDQVPGNGQ
jgi:hypothetical protein